MANVFEIVNSIVKHQSNYDELWAQACAYDGIDSYELFIVFDDANPYVLPLNEESTRIQEYRLTLFQMAHPHAAQQYIDSLSAENT